MRKLNLTDTILDKLGFSEYWDEHGTWGGRTLTFKNGLKFRIIDQEEMDDDTEGYGDGTYIAQHFYFGGWFAWEKINGEHDLFFLHEMYECIEKYYPTCLEEFVEKCKSLRMKIYIDDFLAVREQKQNEA
jgi:hypothetical protein